MKHLLLGVAAAALLSGAAQAAQITTKEAAVVTALGDDNYSFTIGGWTGGGTLSGTFSGTAADDPQGNPGTQIVWFGGGTLTAFLADLTGNAIVGPQTFTFADLFGFVYTIGNPNFGTDPSGAIEGIGAMTDTAELVFGPGPFRLCNGQQDCGQITTRDEVSEPATLALLGAGLLGLAAVRRRKA